MQEKISDPILGEQCEVFRTGNHTWASFDKDFRPAGKRIRVLVDVSNGNVSDREHYLYTEIEEWFPSGLSAIVESMLHRFDEYYKTETEWPSATEASKHFQLEMIDIRSHIPPSKCVLHFMTDLDDVGWYARLSKEYQVEFCEPKD